MNSEAACLVHANHQRDDPDEHMLNDLCFHLFTSTPMAFSTDMVDFIPRSQMNLAVPSCKLLLLYMNSIRCKQMMEKKGKVMASGTLLTPCLSNEYIHTFLSAAVIWVAWLLEHATSVQ